MDRREFLLGAGAAAGLVGSAGAAVGATSALAFTDLYTAVGVLGLAFSDKVKELDGREVRMKGYMAPPLRADAEFFVLTRDPVALCPFCQSDADWPADIVVVYLKRGTAAFSATDPLDVSGRLEVGSKTDEKSGFVSLLRIVEASVSRSAS